MKSITVPLLLLTAMTLIAAPTMARQRTEAKPIPGPITLGAAVRYALEHYPAIRARMEEKAAAESTVDLARTAYLPKIDTLLTVNRGTRNNVFGALFPQPVIPSISGPVLGSSTRDTTFGSAAGVLLGWEPFDFGLRSANVGVAEARRDEANAQLVLTRHQVAFAVADAFLAVAASQQAVRAAQANVDRLQTVRDSVHVLVENQLRPGADESRIQVELSVARGQAIGAEERLGQRLASLAELLGAAGTPVQIDAASLLTSIPEKAVADTVIESHPLALARMSSIRSSAARLNALDHASLPRFTVQGAVWARGTGALTDGTFLGGGNGLAPTTATNGALGLSLSFSFSDLVTNREKKAIERHTEAAEAALYEQTLQKLNGDLARARTEREGAEKIVQNTPAELRAARTIDEQSRARYQAGLGTIVEVADAQRLLAQAEIDDAIGRLSLWRARLSEAAAAGDILTAFK